MVERPLVIGQEAQFGLDVFRGQLSRPGGIGLGNGPNQTALPEHEGIHLELKSGQRLRVEPHLDLSERQLRPQSCPGGICAFEADVFGDQALIPAQTETGKLKVQAVRAQLFEQRFFYEARQADLIDIDQGTEEGKDKKPDGEAKGAEAGPAAAPEAAFGSRSFGHQYSAPKAFGAKFIVRGWYGSRARRGRAAVEGQKSTAPH